jgi:hypothetical protein
MFVFPRMLVPLEDRASRFGHLDDARSPGGQAVTQIVEIRPSDIGWQLQKPTSVSRRNRWQFAVESR